MSTRKEHLFTIQELKVIECLKSMSIQETADAMGIRRGTVNSYLNRIRNKIGVAVQTANMSASWKDSRRYPRLGKLLRRQGCARARGEAE